MLNASSKSTRKTLVQHPCSYDIETSQQIDIENEVTGFYMMET